MIDRGGRDTAAKLVSSFALGEITNDDLEAQWPENSGDRALDAVYHRVWGYYSDTHTHKIQKARKSSAGSMEILGRAAFFLRSDLEYEWRDLGFHSFFNPMLFALRRGWLSEKQKTEFHLGDYNVWPFFKKTDFEQLKLDANTLARF